MSCSDIFGSCSQGSLHSFAVCGAGYLNLVVARIITTCTKNSMDEDKGKEECRTLKR